MNSNNKQGFFEIFGKKSVYVFRLQQVIQQQTLLINFNADSLDYIFQFAQNLVEHSSIDLKRWNSIFS